MTTLFTIAGAAKTYGVSKEMLVNAVDAGQLPAIKDGKKTLLREASIDRFLAGQDKIQ